MRAVQRELCKRLKSFNRSPVSCYPCPHPQIIGALASCGSLRPPLATDRPNNIVVVVGHSCQNASVFPLLVNRNIGVPFGGGVLFSNLNFWAQSRVAFSGREQRVSVQPVHYPRLDVGGSADHGCADPSWPRGLYSQGIAVASVDGKLEEAPSR